MSKRINCDDGSERKRKRGRPSVIESKGDPHLALKASAMRSAGYSWSKIAFYLGIGKTTARRLARLCQNENESQIANESVSAVPKTGNQRNSKKKNQAPEFAIDEAFLDCMPKTFKMFASLIKRSRENR